MVLYFKRNYLKFNFNFHPSFIPFNILDHPSFEIN